MKKFSLILLLILAVFYIQPVFTQAQVQPFNTNAPGAVAPCEAETPGEKPSICDDTDPDENPVTGAGGLFEVGLRLFLWVIGIASVVMLIISGLRFIYSNGNPQSIQQARNTALYSVIGLGVAFSAWAILRYVYDIFG